MGIKEEITKIVVEQGYEGAKPKSIAQAIDALADTLAGEDVTGSRSISGAIHALAPYIGSGGGGGGELGPLQLAPLVYVNGVNGEPTVGESLKTEEYSLDMKAGDIEVVEHGVVHFNEILTKVAANATVTLYVSSVTELSAAYVVTYNNSIPFPKITDVTEWDGECTFTPGGDNNPSITFTMTELGENQVLAFKFDRLV